MSSVGIPIEPERGLESNPKVLPQNLEHEVNFIKYFGFSTRSTGGHKQSSYILCRYIYTTIYRLCAHDHTS